MRLGYRKPESQTKQCRICGKQKPTNAFYKYGRYLRPYCKPCDGAKSNAWSKANRARANVSKAASIARHKQATAARNKRWRVANAEYLRAKNAEWRAKNSDR